EVVSLFSIFVFMLCSSISIFSFSFRESLRGHREYVLEWKKRGWSFFGASLSQQLLTSAHIFLVGVFFGTENAAVYALASRISKASVIGNKAVNEYLSPAISSAFFQKDNERIKRMFYYSCYVALAFSLLYVMFFIFVKDY